jgi:hypothetical protein
VLTHTHAPYAPDSNNHIHAQMQFVCCACMWVLQGLFSPWRASSAQLIRPSKQQCSLRRTRHGLQ